MFLKVGPTIQDDEIMVLYQLSEVQPGELLMIFLSISFTHWYIGLL